MEKWVEVFPTFHHVPGEILVEPDWVFVMDHKHIQLLHREAALSLKFNILIIFQSLMHLTFPIQWVFTGLMWQPTLHYAVHQLASGSIYL